MAPLPRPNCGTVLQHHYHQADRTLHLPGQGVSEEETMPRQHSQCERRPSIQDRSLCSMSGTTKHLMMFVALLLMCFSVNFCLIVTETAHEETPDFNLLSGLTKTFFHKHSEGAPVCSAMDPKNITYTLVTQMSIDRFWLANRHCRRWKGPISMAVVTGRQSSEDLMRRLQEKGCDTSLITIEAVQNIHSEYAVNTLRNMAIRNVKTSHFVYVDIDFWVSANLHDVLYMESVRDALAEDPKLALVLPAFALAKDYRCEDKDCTDQVKEMMPMHPEQLYALQNETVETAEHKFVPQVTAFDELVNPLGHNTTLYADWYDQTLGSLHPIPCFQSGKYEPYLVVRYCRDMPPFQEDFTGYGKNKVEWIWHLRRVGYIFKQVGQVFVIHYPHKTSRAKRAWDKQSKKYKLFGNVSSDLATYKRAQMDEIYVRFRNWLSRMKTPVRTPRCEDWIDTDNNLWSATPLVEKPW
mmetsp:Transcript_101485/g.152028  ORF Transcript_101485/g.152028 Transcript_101485/m.152028 type:complete len:466 (+) Transcript_101485:94-1491(+)